MRFPVKKPALASVVFWDNALLKLVKVLDDHCSPRTSTFVRFSRMLEVALGSSKLVIQRYNDNTY